MKAEDILTNKEVLLRDYYIGQQSRWASILGRKEVLNGRANFGIFGDGKELVQLAMAHFFQPGDWRSGYYRDQTWMMALGLLTLEEFFSMIYGTPSLEANRHNGGRNMNNHFGTKFIDEHGNWLDQTQLYNSSSDIAPTAGQMPRLLGLAMASWWYRITNTNNKFSRQGNEVAWGSIGDASTSEGHFWETFNAAAVLQVPMAVFVYDDGFGISVTKDKQTAKQSISKALRGFQRDELPGIEIFTVKAWDYPSLLKTIETGISICRREHVPVLFHIEEVTQPLGHSTSGSHERYKSPERLQWEQDADCLKRFREYLLTHQLASEAELDEIEKQAQDDVKKAKQDAWKKFIAPIETMRKELIHLADISSCHCQKSRDINEVLQKLQQIGEPTRKDVISSAKQILRNFCQTCSSERPLKKQLTIWLNEKLKDKDDLYSSHLYSQTPYAAKYVKETPILYAEKEEYAPGYEILRDNFDALLAKYPNLVAFGEDVGKIGGVNQTWAGLQKKYGEHRVFDTGIRETTIVGQAIGMALRGLRPIAEIQYLDYLLYAIQTLSDDVATLRWRTVGQQAVPLIISTRGHRLVGVWHAGSPMSLLLGSVRGMYVLTPRNMTVAAAFYNTMLQSDDPAIIIEPLNGYRIRERKPINFGEFTIPIGKPEILHPGKDVTLVTYGSTVRLAQEAVLQLEKFNISVELIDVQTLLPFDTYHLIIESLKKTNKIVFLDEDVPGGATAYMMEQVLERDGGWKWLDAEPRTITGKEHRPAYGTDGDYYSNPQVEDIFDTIYQMMHEYQPSKYPTIY